MTVKLELDQRSQKKDGTYPIKLRVTVNRKPMRISLGHSVEAKYWDASAQAVKTSCRSVQNVTRLNNYLQKQKSNALDVLTQLQDSGEIHALPSKEIKHRIKGDKRNNFVLAFAEEIIAELEQAGKVGNARVYRTLQNSLKNYLDDRDIPLTHITYQWLKKYEAWYLSRKIRGRRNTLNGLSVHLRTLRALFNRAIKRKLVSRDAYPFRDYQIKKSSTRKRAISRADIARIETFEPQTDRHRRAKDYFLMSFYLMGASFVDLAFLRVSDIQNGRISYERKKTGRLHSIKIMPPLQQLLDRYLPGKAKDDFMLDVIRSEEVDQQYVNIRDELRRYNRSLKEIGELCGIEKVLTSYVARHSFATIAKYKGVPVEVISETLGHADVKTTQIYLEQFDKETLDDYHELIIGDK